MPGIDEDRHADADAKAFGPIRRWWHGGLLGHLLVLVVALLGVVWATSSGASFATDDGSYELQLRALDQGSWVWHTPTDRLDPTGAHYPIVYAVPSPHGFVPLAKHPLWPELAHLISPVTGVGAAYKVLSVLAMILAAVAAWFLAGDGARERRPWALWITAAAPVVVTITIGWAHAAAAAAAGVAVLGAARLVRRGLAALPLVLLLVGLVVGMLLRSEGVLLALAVAGGLVVGGRRAGRSWPWVAGMAGMVLVLIAATVKAEGRWINAITGGGSSTLHPRSNTTPASSTFVTERWLGAVRSLIEATDQVPRAALVAVLLAVAVSSLLVSLGRTRWVPVWQVAVAGSVMLLVLRVVAAPTLPVTGLLVAWPVLIVGAAAAAPDLWRRLPLESTVSVLFVGAILATQYADGGAGQWGGRFYAPVTVPLAVITVLGLHRILATVRPLGADATRVARLLVVLVVLGPLLAGVLSVRSARSASANLFAAVQAQVDGVAVTPVEQLPRMMWRQDLPWLVVAADDSGRDLGELLNRLARPDGPRTVSLVLRDADRADARRALRASPRWSVVRTSDAVGLTVVVLRR